MSFPDRRHKLTFCGAHGCNLFASASACLRQSANPGASTPQNSESSTISWSMLQKQSPLIWRR
ncbi:hypothetical protein EGR_10843 [Echinococcus granulosus]|uniref:Uncharacterized protein n=1 Tax=Echinococcus granulosus TaxID=6210 RepID=W6U7F3_ECHGR|nr:hypothetical protein EGR_10843 [Echinococcus granulosus]EUB54302.1 hypothetical protein EGR_10843 [Echinococcus granulosus]